jgi:hypothetical protein
MTVFHHTGIDAVISHTCIKAIIHHTRVGIIVLAAFKRVYAVMVAACFKCVLRCLTLFGAVDAVRAV